MTRTTKVALITGRNYRSPRLLAEGLQRMLTRLGVESELFLDGIDWLRRSGKNATRRDALLNATTNWSVEKRLRSCTLFVIVWYSPGAFRDGFDIGPLRRFNKPILQYAVYFLGGNPYWQERLPPDAVDRYDGYLVASALHEGPVTSTKPVYQIGLDLEPPHSFLRTRDTFRVLFDFPREGYEKEREVQKAAVEELGLPSVELSGEYTFSQIEKIYQRVSLAFVAFYEAFGVPIAQLQYYGAVVASPTIGWVRRHALRAPGTVTNDLAESDFSDNFVFYSSCDDLKDKLRLMRERHDAMETRRILLASQPHLVTGNLESLWLAIMEHS